jgi:hypothetical protein
MREQRIDGRRPEPGRLAHGVADADDAGGHIPAAQHVLRHDRAVAVVIAGAAADELAHDVGAPSGCLPE